MVISEVTFLLKPKADKVSTKIFNICFKAILITHIINVKKTKFSLGQCIHLIHPTPHLNSTTS